MDEINYLLCVKKPTDLMDQKDKDQTVRNQESGNVYLSQKTLTYITELENPKHNDVNSKRDGRLQLIIIPKLIAITGATQIKTRHLLIINKYIISQKQTILSTKTSVGLITTII